MKKIFLAVVFLLVSSGSHYSNAQINLGSAPLSTNITIPTVTLSTIFLNDLVECLDVDPIAKDLCYFNEGRLSGAEVVNLVTRAAAALNCSKAVDGYESVKWDNPSSAPGSLVISSIKRKGEVLSCKVSPTQLGFVKYTGALDFNAIVRTCLERDLNTIYHNIYTKEVFIGKVQ